MARFDLNHFRTFSFKSSAGLQKAESTTKNCQHLDHFGQAKVGFKGLKPVVELWLLFTSECYLIRVVCSPFGLHLSRVYFFIYGLSDCNRKRFFSKCIVSPLLLPIYKHTTFLPQLNWTFYGVWQRKSFNQKNVKTMGYFCPVLLCII